MEMPHGEVVTIRMIPLHQDPFDVAQKPLLYVQLALKRLLLVEVVELFQVFQLEQLCTFSIFYSLMIWPGRPDHDISLMIWPGRPNHDIEGWDLFSKNSGSREELKMVQHRILLRYFEWNLSPPHLLSLLHKGISEVKRFPSN